MSEFKVKVPVVCNRTGKLEHKEMSVEDAQKFNMLKDQRNELANDVATFLDGLPSDTRPDLVISFRGRTAVFSTVVEKKADAGVLRLLHELAPDTFAAVPVTPRKKTDNSGKSVSDTPAAD